MTHEFSNHSSLFYKTECFIYVCFQKTNETICLCLQSITKWPPLLEILSLHHCQFSSFFTETIYLQSELTFFSVYMHKFILSQTNCVNIIVSILFTLLNIDNSFHILIENTRLYYLLCLLCYIEIRYYSFCGKALCVIA